MIVRSIRRQTVLVGWLGAAVLMAAGCKDSQPEPERRGAQPAKPNWTQNKPNRAPSKGGEDRIARLERQAAEGNAGATLALANHYEQGKLVHRDPRKALELFQQAAQAGNAQAQWMLADKYLGGKGVPKDYREAFKWLRKSASRDNQWAEYHVGEALRLKRGLPKEHAEKDARTRMSEAIKWYERSAEHGNPEAQVRLGRYHLEGRWAPLDYEKAVNYMEQAYTTDRVKFRDQLVYAISMYVAADPAKGAEWYVKFAEKGDLWAYERLGDVHRLGYGVDWNPEEAVQWYRKGAEKGSAGCKFELALLCYEGKGTRKDLVESFRLLRQAVELKHEFASEALKTLKPQLSEEQLAEAMKVAPVVPSKDG